MPRRPTHADELLAEIARLGVSASADGERLVLRGPQGAITPELREALARHKPALLRRLAEEADGGLSYAQERLWLLAHMEEGSPAYHLPAVLALDGRLDVGALERSLDEIQRRHEILRTAFPAIGGRPVRRVASLAPHVLRVVEVPGEAAAEREAAARRLAREEVTRPFDLGRGPLFRSLLLRLDPERHVLVLTLHHVVSDGRSVGVLVHEISQLYTAGVEGRPSPLPDLKMQYADVARWQRETLRGEPLEAQIAYWRGKLAGLPRLELQGDRPRPATPSHRGGLESAGIDAPLTDRVRSLARQEAATPFMVLLAAFDVVLRRWAATEDVAVGTPIANHLRPEAEPLIGPFVNTLVLRTDLSGGPTFRELVGRVREVALEAYAHQDVPFERVLAELQPERDVARSPLFQVFFNMANYRVERMDLPGLALRFLDVDADFAKFDLSVYVFDLASTLGVCFNYSLDCFEPATARRMLEQYQTVLGRAVLDPDRTVASLLDPPPRSRRAVPAARGREASLPSRFAAIVAGHRDRAAVRDAGRDLTYGDLASAAAAIARAVRGVGQSRPGRVGLVFDHGAPMVGGMLGVLGAGGAYVPLDPRHPRERLRFTAGDADLDCLLADQANAALARELAGPRRRVVLAEDALARGGDPEPVPVEPDAVAYLLYTSGSTGRPKGVVQSHRNVGRHADNYAGALGLNPDDRLTLLASYTHDAAVVDVFGALLHGATLFPCDLTNDGLDGLEAWMESRLPTIYHSTPTVFRAFLRGRRGRAPFASVRRVVLGGEAAGPPDLALFRAHFPPAASLVNGLGATESTFHLMHVTDAEAAVDGRVLPVGEPLDGIDVVLLDDRGRPTDLRGEIAVRGDGLALGYWRQPDLTAAAFVPDPDGWGGRLYRTGDVGHRRADGRYVFEGRRDLQVKVRGVRVELGEVEAALAAHPAVRDSAALLFEPAPGEAAIAAYYVPREAPGPATADLSRHLRETLPAAMVPAALVRLDALPLTASRKLDRRALPLPTLGAGLAGFVPPRSPLEEDLATLWRDVLAVERVGVHDSFFDLGGHSLKATRLVSRIRDVLGVEVPLRTVFEAPTVAQLAESVAAARRAEDARPQEPIRRQARPASGEMRFPASFAQQRLFFLHQLQPDSPAYVLSGGIRMQGDLDEAALRGALERIASRHEALRTRFATVDGDLVQVVAPEARPPFETVDARDAARPEARLAAIAAEEARRPFALEEGPLLRVKLVRTAADEHVLLISLHHIVADGWSLGVFVRELAAHYRAAREGRPSLVAELPVQYGDFAAWQRSELAGGRLETDLAFWRETLGPEPPVLELPKDRGRPAAAGWRGRAHALSIPTETVERLHDLCRAQAVTPFMALFAAFAAVLARHTGQDDLVVGTPVANRHRGEVEGLIGFFVNALPLRVDLSGDPTFVELLRRVREAALSAYAHQDVPLERLASALGLPRDLARNPLFQTVFALQNAPREALELPGLRTSPFRRDVTATRFDLEALLFESEDGLHGLIVYAEDLFSPEWVARLAAHYLTLLDGALASPQRRLSELPLLGTDERRRLEAAARGAAPAHADPPVHEQVEARARAAPGAVAVVAGASRLRYGDLDRRANQLAWRLRRLEVGPGRVVGVCLERSAELVVAELAVLKAGGAYLPLDPAHPDDRMLFMLEDAGVAAVVTGERFRSRLSGRAPIVDVESADLSAESDAPPRVPVDPDDLAYVIYTSGSTGRPKGVEVPHRGLSNLVGWHRARYEPGPGDRATLVASPAFDASVWETWPYLASGASLHVPPEEARLAPDRLVGWLGSEAITHVFLPTPLAEAVLREPLPSLALRWLLTGGDRLRRLERKSLPFELVNHYGPTESSVVATAGMVDPAVPREPSIGRPIDGLSAWALDRFVQPVPAGVTGELYVGGVGLARGYRGRPDLTAERFVPSPFGDGERLYRTGDLVRWDPDEGLEFLGRNDEQVKVRGHRVELGEIESVLREMPDVADAVALARGTGADSLAAYVVPAPGSPREGDLAARVRAHARRHLPDHMVPAAVVVLAALPLGPNGKVDRRALPAPEPAAVPQAAAPLGPIEEVIAAAWRAVLERDDVGADDNFFDAGGHSLLLASLHRSLQGRLPREISLLELFEFPTIRSLAGHVASPERSGSRAVAEARDASLAATGGVSRGRDVAVVGLAGRFPGAPDVEAFWRNLCDGVESISFLSREELLAAGVDPALADRADYVPARGILDGADLFDPGFFGYSPREASLIDPQQRLLLECAHEALEGAGIDPTRGGGRVGVFAGVSASSYHARLASDPATLASLDGLSTALAADKDFAATRASYKLDLRGPSLAVQTACSTSLVAVHLACRSLLDGECDTALAGGARVFVPQASGYLFQEGSILSPDGHCRVFDAGAAGCVPGNGVGVVVLRRLEDALADREPVLAVIRGSAVNNDGSAKAGYTAPSVEGQAAVIAAAQAAAGTPPETIGFVEAHGTGTRVGDPIEVTALTRAFRAGTGARGFCALGAVKANVGHLDAASGVTGLIKAVLALRHARIPPTPHFREPNPEIGLADSPFFVNTEPLAWARSAGPRRAGVSSFGLGGTNAHVVLEEAAPVAPTAGGREWQVLPLAARTPEAREALTVGLADHLRRLPEADLVDAAWTLQTGRRRFRHRRAVVGRSPAEAAAALEGADARAVVSGDAGDDVRTVAFLLPGQGAQHVDMARGLYASEPLFREEVDRGCRVLEAEGGLDLRAVLYPTDTGREEAERALVRTDVAQATLFVVEYALARLWKSWGVVPAALLGHSLGEYVAACLAGVFSLEDALALVAERGRLMRELPAGAMTAVPLPEGRLAARCGDGVDLAAVNAPELCVVAGPVERIEALERSLLDEGTVCRRLRTSHAFHSWMMDPVRERFRARVARMRLASPRIPFLSNLTGTWITAVQAVDPDYWTEHLRRPVRFAEGVRELLSAPRALVEVGPGHALSSLARAQGATLAVPSLAPPAAGHPDSAAMLRALASLWVAGVEPDWAGVQAPARPRKTALPTYPYDRRRCWIEPVPRTATARPAPSPGPGSGDWFHVPSWTRTAAAAAPPPDGAAWLVFADRTGLGAALTRRLAAAGSTVACVEAGEAWGEVGPLSFRIRPAREEDYARLLSTLSARGIEPTRVAHAWAVDAGQGFDAAQGRDAAQDLGFHSLRLLARALAASGGHVRREILLVTCGAHDVTGEEDLRPEYATALAAAKVVPQEYPALGTRSVDLLPNDIAADPDASAGSVLAEMGAAPEERVVTHRRGHRWVQGFAPLRLDAKAPKARRLREAGVYLIVGGLGAVGLRCAALLAEAGRARLVLVSRSGLPPRGEWDRIVERHGAEDPLRARVEAVRRLEERGAEVLVLTADVGDEARMRSVFAEARARFGALHGVFHAAGSDKRAVPLASLDSDAYERELRPKVHGLEVLGTLLDEQPVDFCFVASSLSSVLGAVGAAAYAAAHAYADAFVAARRRKAGTAWISANLDNWSGTEAEGAASEAGFGMSAEEGMEALRLILDAPSAKQVVVSAGDLRWRLDRWVHRPAPVAAPSGAARQARPALGTPYAPPETEREKALVAIWQELLGTEPIGIHDDFFELGGDSVVSIQVAARAAGAGLRLSARSVMEGPTIAELAARSQRAPTEGPAPGADAGPFPLTPIQRWFFDLGLRVPQHFNQAVLLEVAPDLGAEDVRRAWGEVVARHDALRLRFTNGGGERRALPASEVDAAPFALVDLSGASEPAPAIAAEADRVHASLDLARGPIARAVFLALGRERPARLLLVAHHLAVDAVSWRILIEELALAAGRGPGAVLPGRGASFAEWAVRLHATALDPELARDGEHWLAQGWDDARPVPVDRPGANEAGSARTLSAAIGPEDTRALLFELPRRYGAAVQDALLAALGLSLREWTGSEAVLVDVEGHGREGLVDGLDLSRTVGWFTSLYPLLVRVDGTDEVGSLLSVKEQVRAVPRHGVSFGLLRHLGGDGPLALRLASLPRPQVSFLYGGRLDATVPEGAPFRPAPEARGTLRHPADPRPHVIDVQAHVADGRLHVGWTYGEQLHEARTIEARLARCTDALRRIAKAARTPGAVLTPSDVPGARLGQRDLDRLALRLGRGREEHP